MLSNDAHAATYSDVSVVPTQLTRLGFLCLLVLFLLLLNTIRRGFIARCNWGRIAHYVGGDLEYVYKSTT